MLGVNMITLVRGMAAEQGIPPEILLGLVDQESAGNVGAIRYEPKFTNFERPFSLWQRGQSQATEEMQQRTSWGLGQVMGATARRFGFKGPYLTELCTEPRLCLYYSCAHLLRDMAAGASLDVAIMRYNSGFRRNPRPDGTYAGVGYLSEVKTKARIYA